MSQEKAGSKIGLIGPGLFRGLVSTSSQTTTTTTTTTDHSQSGVSAVSDCTDSIDRTPQLHHQHPEKRQKVMIPMQVLVPPSMKSLSFSNAERPETETNNKSSSSGRNIFDFMIPEERVHGGGLMSLLNGSLRNKHSIDGI
jgi:hypothetical protein